MRSTAIQFEKKYQYLLCIICLAFALRVLFVISFYAAPNVDLDYNTKDAKEYVSLAEELVRHGRFMSSTCPIIGARINLPEIVRTPGYPLFLVPGVWLGHLRLVTVPLQIFLSCLTVFDVPAVLSLVREGKARPAKRIHFCFGSHVDFFYSLPFDRNTRRVPDYSRGVFPYKVLPSRLPQPSAVIRFLCAASMFVRPICYYLPVFLAIALLAYRVIKGPAG